MRKEWRQLKLVIKRVLDDKQIPIWEKIIIIEAYLENFRQIYGIL